MGVVPSSDSQWNINSTEFVTEKIFGSHAFFQLYVSVDDKNSSLNVLTVKSIHTSTFLYVYNYIT